MRLSLHEQLHHDRAAARRARSKAEQARSELSRLRHEHAAIRVSLALIKLQRVLDRKYDPNQARVAERRAVDERETLAFSATLNQA